MCWYRSRQRQLAAYLSNPRNAQIVIVGGRAYLHQMCERQSVSTEPPTHMNLHLTAQKSGCELLKWFHTLEEVTLYTKVQGCSQWRGPPHAGWETGAEWERDSQIRSRLCYFLFSFLFFAGELFAFSRRHAVSSRVTFTSIGSISLLVSYWASLWSPINRNTFWFECMWGFSLIWSFSPPPSLCELLCKTH